ncbi:MAG: PASTA domain-containing protein [Lishizhenia sp.]
MSSLSYFDSYTKHGEQIEVPVLASKNKSELVNVAQLEELLRDKSLSYEVLDSIYNPNLVEGTVVYQDPLPTKESGQFVKSGRVIKVRVSKQSRQVTVPKLIDKSQRYAEGMLTTLGLRSKAKYVPSDVNGSVLEISYKGKPVKHGQKLPVNAIIELTIGKNTGGTLVSVPDLNGLTIFEAESRLKNNNALNLYVSCAQCLTSSDSLNARIMTQTPIAGDSSLVPQGTTITAFASLGIEDSTY